jgi:hypothetical protein
MLRRQIYLTEDIERNIISISRREQKNSSQVIRELIEDGLKRKQQASLGDALLGFAALGEKYDLTAKTPPDLSEHLDDYLYGDND